jgi:hypothetical protein
MGVWVLWEEAFPWETRLAFRPQGTENSDPVTPASGPPPGGSRPELASTPRCHGDHRIIFFPSSFSSHFLSSTRHPDLRSLQSKRQVWPSAGSSVFCPCITASACPAARTSRLRCPTPTPPPRISTPPCVESCLEPGFGPGAALPTCAEPHSLRPSAAALPRRGGALCLAHKWCAPRERTTLRHPRNYSLETVNFPVFRLMSPEPPAMHQIGKTDTDGTCIAPPLGCAVSKRLGPSAAKLEDPKRGS